MYGDANENDITVSFGVPVIPETLGQLDQTVLTVCPPAKARSEDYNAKALEAHSNTNPWALLDQNMEAV